MRYANVIFVLFLITALGVASYLLLRGFEVIGQDNPIRARPVPPGDQEIAFLSPANDADTWERLVEAARRVQADALDPLGQGRPLHLNMERAFVDLTAEVPEIALWPEGGEGSKLWIRWYKISYGADTAAWVKLLAGTSERAPPLAILGGSSTNRAIELLKALSSHSRQWKGPDPLLLITTATAVSARKNPGDLMARPPGVEPPRLTDRYPGRSFRFSFTNARMAECVMDFVQQYPEAWLPDRCDPLLPMLPLAASNPLEAAVWLQAADPLFLYWVAWEDDSYSEDLAYRFTELFGRTINRDNLFGDWVTYSTGDPNVPNPRERWVALRLFDPDYGPGLGHRRVLLVLPTAAQRAHRFLRMLVRSAPLDIRRLVVVSGDSITFDDIYRDRFSHWNILDVPVPLVFFAHRNPMDHAMHFSPIASPERPWASTSTQSLLLFKDIQEALVVAAYRKGRLVSNSDELADELRRLRWLGRISGGEQGRLLFDADGNREPGTGEHLIWLQPRWKGQTVTPLAELKVFRRESRHEEQARWVHTDSISPVLYTPPVEIRVDPPVFHAPFGVRTEH